MFRAKREMDLTSTRSIFPCLHWRIIRRKAGRLEAEVPEMPSSAKIPAMVHWGLVMILSV